MTKSVVALLASIAVVGLFGLAYWKIPSFQSSVKSTASWVKSWFSSAPDSGAAAKAGPVSPNPFVPADPEKDAGAGLVGANYYPRSSHPALRGGINRAFLPVRSKRWDGSFLNRIRGPVPLHDGRSKVVNGFGYDARSYGSLGIGASEESRAHNARQRREAFASC